MLDMITKSDYWTYLDSKAAKVQRAGLKDIQDAFILYELREASSLKICEVGGGDSRVLPILADRANECWNADPLEGSGQGPTEVAKNKAFKLVKQNVGDFSEELPSEYFDVVFSISVVEHIPGKDLGNAMKDMLRILKPGGIMYHAIDLYLFDDLDAHPQARSQVGRIQQYVDFVDSMGPPTSWLETPVIDAELTASSCFATNNMDLLWHWNRMVPSLREVRAMASSCSLRVAIQKNA